jgi:4-diphosphocytidyl-2-C-methyl-D-erythritol kinase
MSDTDRLVLDSPAKVNLRLDIVAERSDGYHELFTVFQKISLCDRLTFRLTRQEGVTIMTNRPDLPTGPENLIARAANLLLSHAGERQGVAVELDKRIPLGAGLGGGSSNAAATLTAVNQLLGLGLSRESLSDLGRRIGADVPFFFMDHAALGRGIGDLLEEVDLPTLWYVLIYPGFEVSAAWAYRNFILTKRQFHLKIRKFSKTAEGISRLLSNDLEAVVSGTRPEIRAMKEMVCSAGALGALMSGSGPAVFGLFGDEPGAAEGFARIEQRAGERGWKVFMAHSI